MNILDIFLFIAILAIWTILIVNIILVIAGYINYLHQVKTPEPVLPAKVPFVSIMVPAHNEGIVIVKTVAALLNFDYPHDRYELIAINDHSDDASAALLGRVLKRHPQRRIPVINTDNRHGG